MAKTIGQYDPYEIGRWYKIFVESDGTDITVTSTDITGVTVNTDALVMPTADWIIGDVKAFAIGESGASASADTSYGTLTISTTGIQQIKLPSADAFTDITYYVFAYVND